MQEPVYVLHLITCHGRIMPRLAELLCVMSARDLLLPQHTKYAEGVYNFRRCRPSIHLYVCPVFPSICPSIRDPIH